jgi:hypothetical protein
MFRSFKLPGHTSRFGCKYKLDDYVKTDPHIYKEGMWTATAFTMLGAMLNFGKQFRNL